jgi:Beta-galactosidase
MHPARAWIGVAAVCLFGCSAQVANAAVPPGFFGVVPQATPTANDLTRLEGVVGTLRIPIYWSESEPAPGEFDFSALDALVGAAAEHGIRVQPFVFGTPAWLASEQARPPLDPRASAAWAEFLTVLVKRYGTGGDSGRGGRSAGRSGSGRFGTSPTS